MTEDIDEFEAYLNYLAQELGQADRHAGLKGYYSGLVLPLSRKSVEPMAAHVDPLHASAKHQSLHYFVTKAEWSDKAIMQRVREWVMLALGAHAAEEAGYYWIIDDTSFPKKGRHSAGVARQYCGQLGKQDSCQVAVSLSITTQRGSLPIAWQLYVPREWIDDRERARRGGIPDDQVFATKPQIALAQLREAIASGIAPGIVLADAGYGDETAFLDGVSELGLLYAVGIRPITSVWEPGKAPLPSKPWSGRGKPPTQLRRAPGHESPAVKALFLKHIDQAVSAGLDVHLIVDNYATHKHPKVKAWLAKHTRYHMHLTPTRSSWRNQVERWLGLITQQAISRGSFRKVHQLIADIERYIEQYNQHKRPFVWTATADSILQKVARL